jgi:hypothetical protein
MAAATAAAAAAYHRASTSLRCCHYRVTRSAHATSTTASCLLLQGEAGACAACTAALVDCAGDAAVCAQALWLAKCLATDSAENTAALAEAGLPQASVAAGRAHPDSESVQEVMQRLQSNVCMITHCMHVYIYWW